ncbi:MAG: hypothetical protein JO115_08200 [Pseudonocardiales bacterium]|nr:hypothetical protein [Pseudonocardiales bacterium]
MRVTSNLQWPEKLFDRLDRFFGVSERFVAALDVEWTKNYHIKGGSRPFCYSVVLLRWPQEGDDLSTYPASFGFKSVYVTEEDDERALIVALDSDLQAWLASDSLLAGHQLSSDLSVAKNASVSTLVGVEGAYALWRTRRSEHGRVFDTRYDVDHLPIGASRRLVDVCGDVKLDVRQPELARGSMTKLQRHFLEHGSESIREQLLTLNVRHSLSTALVACLGMGLVSVGARNVNQLVHQEMWDLVEYVRSEHFKRLLR